MIKHRGVALITVLLIVALLTALVYHLMVRQSLVLAKSRQALYTDQARAYARGGESFARQILYEDWQAESSRDHDSLDEPWAQVVEPLMLESGYLEISIVDMNRRFNLNSMAGETAEANVERFKRLLAALNLGPEIAYAWRDWVDRDSNLAGFGAEDSDYLMSNPAYRAANQPARHVSELRLMKDITRETYQTILPYITVLPTTGLRVNINTADAITLQSVTAKLAPSKAQSLVESVRSYTSLDSVKQELPEFVGSDDVLSVLSAYFEVQVGVDIDGSRVELTSLLHRDPLNGRLTTLSRDYSKRFVRRQLEQNAETDY